MKKWIISAIVYLVIVVGVYSIWKGTDTNSTQENHAAMKEETSTSHEHSGHDNQQYTSEVKPTVSYTDGTISIVLKDSSDQLVHELEVNHEKLMHLIVVSDDLQQYYHLHPTKTGEGMFEIDFPLDDGMYKAFIDIKPKGLKYEVEPLAVQIGNASAHHHETELTPDAQFTKTIEEYTVTMEPQSFQAGTPITLSFSFANERVPEPYLGALGHVVILDEHGEAYGHVHPVSTKETKFETTFAAPGIYKIWAEFQFGGTVITYPFVIKVEE